MTNYRKFRAIWQIFCLLLVAVTFYLFWPGQPELAKAPTQPAPPSRPHDLEKPPGATESASTVPPGKLGKATISQYVKSILNPEDTSLPRLACPRPDLSRYQYLKPVAATVSEIQYFFALNLKENLPILPRLLGSIVEAIRFLGPEHCTLSIVEGNSPDGTDEVLAALRPEVDKLLHGPANFVLSNTINPLEGGDGVRFSKLADLRNMALRPLVESPARYRNATVIFVNDVAICLEDILELVHQRQFQESDMVCAMDWVGDKPPIFYDSYIARTMAGDLFFNIPPETASYSLATDLFRNEPVAKARFEAHRPFQVFSCWNGAVAFTARPVVEGQVAFRASREDKGECYQAEPQLFCKDMWFSGYGKIAVVPSVNLAYSDEDGRRIKEEKGYSSRWVSGSDALIEWKPPPERVKCMPTFTDQTWRPWNETL